MARVPVVQRTETKNYCNMLKNVIFQFCLLMYLYLTYSAVLPETIVT